ncbi:efflux RND transporter periplasmic adaptor subunit [Candidatus Sumerlaeota bacterium]|nr:efflux RND transporter periplasmic adaptor subunit [Candidatus Sumerlaeota bacterium]
MSGQNSAGANPPNLATRSVRLLFSLFVKVILPILVLTGATLAAIYLMESGPKSSRQKPVRNARLVETLLAAPIEASVTIEGMGTVKASRVAQLQPRVSGQVIEMSPALIPGGLLSEGEIVLRIDSKDYELNVRQRKAELASIQSELKIEEGQQSIARNEYQLLQKEIAPEDEEWVLRKPQMESAQAKVDTAQAALELAQLELERTKVQAPFNAVVQSRDVNLGMQVNVSTSLATLVGADEYWVTVALPVNQLKWITIPRKTGETGSMVRVYDEAAWGAGIYRTGRVLRLESALEEEGRMAQLLVSVADPLALQPENEDQPALLIGSYVSVEIEGSALEDVYALDRALLRDGDQVWIMTPEDTLEIRLVKVAHRGPEQLLVSEGLSPGERVVVTTLSAPVEGMALRVAESEAASSPTLQGTETTDDGTLTEAPQS